MQLGSKAAKADAIYHNLGKTISIKRDLNPAFYDSFSKRINEVLQAYREHRINEVEYLEAMTKILNDFRNNNSGIHYPECIKNNVHAEAFYGVIYPILNEFNEFDIELIGQIALDITSIIQKWAKVDFANNVEVHKHIDQDIDDLFWEYEKKGIKVDNVKVEKITENVKAVAIKRF